LQTASRSAPVRPGARCRASAHHRSACGRRLRPDRESAHRIGARSV